MEYVNFAKSKRGWPSVRTKLDGVFYRLEAVWNNIEERWSLQIYDAAGGLLRSGLAMRHGVDMLEPYRGAKFPGGGAGKLRPWDTANQQRDPGRDDLGKTSAVRLVYIPASEAT